jgi:hypothetical protein
VNKQKQIHAEAEALLEEIGGVSLSGSGFENETPEPEFSEPESVSAGEER